MKKKEKDILIKYVLALQDEIYHDMRRESLRADNTGKSSWWLRLYGDKPKAKERADALVNFVESTLDGTFQLRMGAKKPHIPLDTIEEVEDEAARDLHTKNPNRW